MCSIWHKLCELSTNISTFFPSNFYSAEHCGQGSNIFRPNDFILQLLYFLVISLVYKLMFWKELVNLTEIKLNIENKLSCILPCFEGDA